MAEIYTLGAGTPTPTPTRFGSSHVLRLGDEDVCDADYNQSGIVDIGDFGLFLQCFSTNNPLCQHTPPITDRTFVSIGDFGFFSANFFLAPGPSGLTAGTTACP